MSRKRFWGAQFIWIISIIIAGGVASGGDEAIIPFVLLSAFVATGFLMKWGKNTKNKASDSVTSYNSHMNVRVMATALIWLTYMGGSVAGVIEMAGWGVLLALVLMIPAVIFTALIWAWERISGFSDFQQQSLGQQTEKRKRQNVDDILDRLSDHDLDQLQQRLNDNYQDEGDVYPKPMLSDDGELVYRRH